VENSEGEFYKRFSIEKPSNRRYQSINFTNL